MKKLSETANKIVDNGDLSQPELMKVDMQVRSGNHIVPPSWCRVAKERAGAEVNNRHHKNKSNT